MFYQKNACLINKTHYWGYQDLAFYLAYVIDKALAVFENGGEIGEFLFNLQFTPQNNSEGKAQEYRFQAPYDNENAHFKSWFMQGLNLLKRVCVRLTQVSKFQKLC